MSWATGLMVYLVIWWTILFAVLPLGVKRIENPGRGQDRGAPEAPQLLRKAVITSLVAAVQYPELFRYAQDIGQNSGAPVEMYFLAAAWYLIMTSILSVGQYYIERYYARGSSRQLPPTPFQRIKVNVLSIGRPKGGAA